MSNFSESKASNIISTQSINNKLPMDLAFRPMKVEYSLRIEEESDVSPHTESRVEVIGGMGGKICLTWIFIDIQGIDCS